MKSLKRRVLMLAGATAMSAAGTLAAQADALPTPSMAGPLAANPNPFSIDLPDWLGDAGGKLYVGGALTGMAYVQSNATHFTPGDADTFGDITNGQVFIEKNDGVLQFFVEAGVYSFPTVGIPYTNAEETTEDTPGFGFVPVAYVKLQGQGSLASFSVEGGKLPTLIGDEYGFTFQNMNIERGLVWNNEPIVSRGAQVNFSSGPLTVSISLNDGYYTDTYNKLSGLISYAFNGGADTLAFAGGGNLSGSNDFGVADSGSVFNLIYTHTSGPWTISPYFQLNETPSNGYKGSTAYAGAVLASYAFDDHWKLAARAEYESESNGVDLFGFGSGSDAFSITVTPTYQWKSLFARIEGSYVTVGGGGSGFGPSGSNTDQFRGMIEAGIIL
jgi:hypothetical protein